MSISLDVGKSLFRSTPIKYLSKFSAAGAVSTIALVSGLSKDVVNCYYYVTQSLKNEKIPEEKRKFVAALDLSNGILNVIMQTAIGVPIAKFADKIFEKKIVPKYFSPEVAAKTYKALKEKFPKISSEVVEGRISRNRSWARGGLAVIATLVGAQIVAKRIIVPLIATPMASYFKKQFEKNDKKSSDKDSHTVNNQAIINNTKIPKCFEDNFK